MALLSRTLFAGFALGAGLASAVNVVQVKQQEFLDTVTNDRLMILGVDYQPGGQGGFNPGSGIDPLSNGTICLRDAALMQSLGVNTLRTYNVDPTLNHDDCASIFNEAGIYMIVDVNSPLGGQSIDRSDPSGSYTAAYLNRTFQVVEAFKNYPNTLGFFGGNEIINDVPSSQNTPPYIRAVQRDLKNYIAKNSPRVIPVGYSAADVDQVIIDNWNYLQCNLESTTVNGVDMSRSDFFGLNDYEWCGDSDYVTSGYSTLIQRFGSTTIPFFFSEYGCNQVPGARPFSEVQSLYGSNMTVLSGGLVYEFTQEPSNFGLININDNGSVSLRQDYDNLQSQYGKLNVTLLNSQNSSATMLNPPSCSQQGLISNSGFNTSFDLPPTPSDANDLIQSGVPGANQGKIVRVTQTNVPVPVYASNGQQIQNLAVKPVANGQSNQPGGNAGTKPGSPKKGGADRSSGPIPGALALVVGLVALFTL